MAVAQPDSSELGGAVRSALSLLELVVAQPELPVEQLADVEAPRLRESQFWGQLELAAVLHARRASELQEQPAWIPALEVQRASEAQPVRAEQQAASCQELPSARLQAWRCATGRSWF